MMGKLKILSSFALLYVVFCAVAVLILRYIYNDTVSIGKLNWINLPSLYFFISLFINLMPKTDFLMFPFPLIIRL